MAGTGHRLERQTALLAARIREQYDAIRNAVAAPGERPPFHEELSASEALKWWSEHRYDQFGQRVLRGWKPDQIADLDVALAKHNEQQFAPPTSLMGGPPTVA